VEDVVEHRDTARDTELEALIGKQVRGCRILGEANRVLVADRDDRRTEPDALGVLCGDGDQGQRRGEVVVEVTIAHPALVVAELLRDAEQLHGVLEPLRSSSRRRLAEGHVREEPELEFSHDRLRGECFGLGNCHERFPFGQGRARASTICWVW
jgi:hypothetical protein